MSDSNYGKIKSAFANPEKKSWSKPTPFTIVQGYSPETLNRMGMKVGPSLPVVNTRKK